MLVWYRVGMEWQRENYRLEGKDIRRLMCVNKVTVRELARRMQITMKRVRQIRELGLDNRQTAREWIEWTTETDPGLL